MLRDSAFNHAASQTVCTAISMWRAPRIPSQSVVSRFTHRSWPATAGGRIRHGLTLVEMLVSVALTLLVVFALVRVFELLGNNVAEGRATIEVSGNLRSAAQLLREDLAGVTVTTLPPRAPEQSEGYLEIVDGPETDQSQLLQKGNDMGLVRLGNPASFTDTEGDGFVDTAAVIGYDTSVGDTDDILAFTSRRTADQPFRGTLSDNRIKSKTGDIIQSQFANAPTVALDSTEAEIIWWVQVERNVISDIDSLSGLNLGQQIANAVSDDPSRLDFVQRYPNAVGTAGTSGFSPGTPVRSLHRRVLLIRPDLDFSNVNIKSREELDTFLSNNDVSVSIEREGSTFTLKANTLGDLAVRHNRSYRHSYRAPPASLARRVLTRIDDTREGGILARNNLLLRQAAMKDMVLPNGTLMMRKAKDVVLSDVMAFDVQVYDPEVQIRVSSDGTTLRPSDPGYIYPYTQPSSMPKGGFVDLGYAVLPKASAAWPNDTTSVWPGGVPAGLFGHAGHPRSGLDIVDRAGRLSGVYCTWCSEYEYDGFDQDDNKVTDQGTNGIDDNGQFGIDDLSERETSPPYPHPLRGISIKLRLMDFSTRQVRQTSVAMDFLPE